MRAGFLFKKLVLWVVVFAFTNVCAIGSFYALYTTKIHMKTEFHFLVSEEKSVAAGVEFAKLEGGAGYILRYNGKDYVVLSVYLSEKDASFVQEALSNQNRQTSLICLSFTSLYFRGTQQRKVGVYVGALQTFYECLSILERNIERLESGMTQEKCRAVLLELKRQFSYMYEIYANVYPDFAVLCGKLVGELQNIVEDIVYASRLRYILCDAVDGYLRLSKEFS